MHGARPACIASSSDTRLAPVEVFLQMLARCEPAATSARSTAPTAMWASPRASATCGYRRAVPPVPVGLVGGPRCVKSYRAVFTVNSGEGFRAVDWSGRCLGGLVGWAKPKLAHRAVGRGGVA
jgi:hypothetical protein